MAMARKCDRCGAFYTENKKNSKLSTVVRGVSLLKGRRCEGPSERNFDLCDSCMDSFLTFIYDFEPQPAEPSEEETEESE